VSDLMADSCSRGPGAFRVGRRPAATGGRGPSAGTGRRPRLARS
jgi:hypothetical protein